MGRLEGRNIRVSSAKPATRKVSWTGLYVKNLPIKWTEEMLTSYFSKVCEITSARILTNRKNGKSRGAGFVHCVSHDEAKKALEWIRGEESRKNGLRLLGMFAKIPQKKRKAQKGLKVEGETIQNGKSDQSLRDLKEVKPASHREANDPSEVEWQTEESQVKRNWYKHNMPAPLSQVSGLEGPTNSSDRMRKNSRRNSIIQKRRRKQRNWGTVNTDSLKTDEYTHYFDNHAQKPRLFCPNSTPYQKTKDPYDHKIQKASGDPRHMQPNRYCSFRGSSDKLYDSSPNPASRYHQFSSTTKDMYENSPRLSNCIPHLMAPPMTLSNPTTYMWTPLSCSNPHAYQRTLPMMPTQIYSVDPPLSSVCMKQVQSPMLIDDQNVGCSGQFVSNPRSMEEQRFICTNKPGPLYTANHSLHSVPQSLHNEQCWSTTLSCSGLTSLNVVKPIRRDET